MLSTRRRRHAKCPFCFRHRWTSFAAPALCRVTGVPGRPHRARPQQPQPLGQRFTYALTQEQIDFIVGRMSGFSVGRFALDLRPLRVEGVRDSGLLDGVRSEFDIFQTPEPAALLLFGAGIAASLRRLRRGRKN